VVGINVTRGVPVGMPTSCVRVGRGDGTQLAKIVIHESALTQPSSTSVGFFRKERFGTQ
jgi:hypothetical protein